jgi:hypothetical protein
MVLILYIKIIEIIDENWKGVADGAPVTNILDKKRIF